MKHEPKYTIALMALTLACVILGVAVSIPLRANIPKGAFAMNPYALAAILVGAILFGAVVWTFALKKFKKEYIDMTFAFIVSMMIGETIGFLLPSGVISTVFVIVLYLVIFFLLFIGANRMRISWKTTRRLMPYINIVMVLFFAFVGARIGNIITPLVALLALGAAAIYDAWAVWKSKTMVAMAKGFLERRVFPMLAIPKEKEGQFALLGGGDLFFIIITIVAFLKTSALVATTAGLGMVAAVIWLFVYGARKKMYPALPYIFTGAISGLVIGWTALVWIRTCGGI